MNKEELEGLVNYGASEIFKAQGSTITDEDIDNLLKRGEERTRQQNMEIDEKLKEKKRL